MSVTKKVLTIPTNEAATASKRNSETAKCEWYLLCRHPGTTMAKHPVLGSIPVCDGHRIEAEKELEKLAEEPLIRRRRASS